MKKDYTKYIKNIVEWTPVTSAPSKMTRKYNELKSLYGTSGVYQIAYEDSLPTNIIDKDICYIGKSVDISPRMCGIKAPRGSHNCRTYISSNKNIDINKVFYRSLYTEPGEENELELLLHEQMQHDFGYRYKWKEASAGSDGALVRIFDALDNIDDLNDLKTISKYIDEIVVKKYLETWKYEE